MSCEHCDTVRTHQSQAVARRGRQGRQPTSYPPRYFTAAPDAPGLYDGDPGECYCPCHDVWRLWRHLIGSAW